MQKGNFGFKTPVDTKIAVTSWTELDIDTLSKSESVKLAKLLAANEVVVASDDGAPCCHQAVCLMVMLQMK